MKQFVLVMAVTIATTSNAYAFSTSDARTCGRVIGAMAVCGIPRAEQERLLSSCMRRAQGSAATNALLDGIEEGTRLAPNASGWSCPDVRRAMRNL